MRIMYCKKIIENRKPMENGLKHQTNKIITDKKNVKKCRKI